MIVKSRISNGYKEKNVKPIECTWKYINEYNDLLRRKSTASRLQSKVIEIQMSDLAHVIHKTAHINFRRIITYACKLGMSSIMIGDGEIVGEDNGGKDHWPAVWRLVNICQLGFSLDAKIMFGVSRNQAQIHTYSIDIICPVEYRNIVYIPNEKGELLLHDDQRCLDPYTVFSVRRQNIS